MGKLNPFQDFVIAVSESGEWEKARLEWVVHGEPEDLGDDWNADREVCVCGKDNLRYVFTISNEVNNELVRPVGSRCIRMIDADLGRKAERLIRELKKRRAEEQRRLEEERLRTEKRAQWERERPAREAKLAVDRQRRAVQLLTGLSQLQMSVLNGERLRLDAPYLSEQVLGWLLEQGAFPANVWNKGDPRDDFNFLCEMRYEDWDMLWPKQRSKVSVLLNRTVAGFMWGWTVANPRSKVVVDVERETEKLRVLDRILEVEQENLTLRALV